MSSWVTSRVAMSEEEFRLFRDIIHNCCGLYFRDDMKYLLERRLAPRLALHGLEDFKSYYRFLRFAPRRGQEMEEVVEILTTNETYFFREAYQLRAFSREILPDLHERNANRRRLRIWSAGCSSGEEPYSIAILILESGLFQGWDVEVFGNDISRKVLTVARRAVYGRHSFRETEDATIRRWFEPVEEGYKVKEEARKLVTFGRMNLLDDQMLGIVGNMDAVFCRNVFIYFDQEAKKRVARVFHDHLRPGGYLLLGHSESLMNLTADFELVHLENDLVYRKPVVDGQDAVELERASPAKPTRG